MSNVSRSVYQKVCEENKRLKEDIRILVRGKIACDQLYENTFYKWHKKFREENKFHKLLKEVAIDYMKEHPELKISKL
jgi:uncharacterized protein involved in tolerance to divalent cations